MKDWTGNSHTTFAIIGASNHSDVVRQKEDYYATEPKAAELLLQHCHLDGPIWEPACGERHLASVFERAGYDVRSSDIIRRCDCEQLDFLSPDNLQMWNGDIVTNPPYKYAQQFVEHSLRLVPDGHKVCMFLKLTFLEGKARKSLFINTPPYRILVSSSRLICAMNGEFDKYPSSAVAYAWYVWVKGFKGMTTVEWIN